MLNCSKLFFPTVLVLFGWGAFCANATPVKTETGKDGKTYVVKNDNERWFRSAHCGNISASILAGQEETLPPNIMVTLGVIVGKQRHGFRIFDVAKDSLTPDHTVQGIKVGCLTHKGGVGILVPSRTLDTPDLKIQIDANGQVFIGYDEAGLELISPKKK